MRSYYLYEKSFYSLEDGGECCRKLFSNKEDALKLYNEEVKEFKKNASSMVCDEDEDNCEFYLDGFYAENHCVFSITELQLEETGAYDTVDLEDITGTLGSWLDNNLAEDIPQDVIDSLNNAYVTAVEHLD